ncbi:MAG: ATP-binding protein [Chloroflexi bacterium]|nr:ATP-binding protein [Chloroflexota bacterium]MQC27625.1 ATP-binding protein [Chloroflexota bacterium]
MSVITNEDSGTTAALDEGRDVERVRAMLGPLPPPRAWPALVVLVGPPGSGKSTLTRALAERLAVVSLDGERIRSELFAAPDYSFRESQRVGRAVRTLVGELLDQRLTVVYDDSNLTEWERQPLYTLAEAHRVRLVLVHVTSPMSVILGRIQGLAEADRHDTVSRVELYERMAGRYEPITRPHLTVDTSHDIRQFVEGVILDLEEG